MKLNRISAIGAVAVSLFATGSAFSQDDDPATQSSLMEETLKTIKEVESLNAYIAQIGELKKANQNLQEANKGLQGQIASLGKQVTQLTAEIKTSNETLRKQLLLLPEFKVKSKLVGKNGAVAVLMMGENIVRIRDKIKMSVPVQDGVWTLMEVQKITKDVIELNFIELDRVITIYN
jgi:FtsZ-binding cell division protein ZapB